MRTLELESICSQNEKIKTGWREKEELVWNPCVLRGGEIDFQVEEVLYVERVRPGERGRLPSIETRLALEGICLERKRDKRYKMM